MDLCFHYTLLLSSLCERMKHAKQRERLRDKRSEGWYICEEKPLGLYPPTI